MIDLSQLKRIAEQRYKIARTRKGVVLAALDATQLAMETINDDDVSYITPEVFELVVPFDADEAGEWNVRKAILTAVEQHIYEGLLDKNYVQIEGIRGK